MVVSMAFLSSLDISGSGLTAQKYRMDIISQNVAGAEITRTPEGGPYKRKLVVMTPRSGKWSFAQYLRSASPSVKDYMQRQGVRVTAVIDDRTPNKVVYDPDHPDANEDGYVEMPNVDMVKEMIDLMGASRSYEANVTVNNTVKQMAAKALEIGR